MPSRSGRRTGASCCSPLPYRSLTALAVRARAGGPRDAGGRGARTEGGDAGRRSDIGSAQSGSWWRRRSRWRCCLVAGAILMSRTLANLRSVPLGLQRRESGALRHRSGPERLRRGARRRNSTRACWSGCGRRPASSARPLSAERLLSGYVLERRGSHRGRRRQARVDLNFVGPDFFETMQIPIARPDAGLAQRDMAAVRRSRWSMRTFVRRQFPGESPLGRRFRWTRAQNSEKSRSSASHATRGTTGFAANCPPRYMCLHAIAPGAGRRQMAVEVRIAGRPRGHSGGGPPRR